MLDLEGDQRELAIVEAVIGLAHALGLTVVAEGVETEGQLRILEALGCDRAQGFLFSASAAPGAVGELVSPPNPILRG
jgi:EAL domain-containing protein (putative c-di-GMP-specific phosphodiesterase class I)